MKCHFIAHISQQGCKSKGYSDILTLSVPLQFQWETLTALIVLIMRARSLGKKNNISIIQAVVKLYLWDFSVASTSNCSCRFSHPLSHRGKSRLSSWKWKRFTAAQNNHWWRTNMSAAHKHSSFSKLVHDSLTVKFCCWLFSLTFCTLDLHSTMFS